MFTALKEMNVRAVIGAGEPLKPSIVPEAMFFLLFLQLSVA